MLKICPCFWVGAGRMGKKEFSVKWCKDVCVCFSWDVSGDFNLFLTWFFLSLNRQLFWLGSRDVWAFKWITRTLMNLGVILISYGVWFYQQTYLNHSMRFTPEKSFKLFFFSNSVRGGDFLLAFPKKEHLLEELFSTLTLKHQNFHIFPKGSESL